MKTKKVYWLSPIDKCDVCEQELTTVATDGKTKLRGGCWALMCPTCMTSFGVGLGTGLGQQYTKQEDGRWLKTAG